MFNIKNLLKPSKTVHIEFNQEEYKKLIELIFVGEWILTHEVDVNNPYDPIRNKIYSHASEVGLSKSIVHDATLGGYHETAKFEDPLMKKINSYVRASQRQK